MLRGKWVAVFMVITSPTREVESVVMGRFAVLVMEDSMLFIYDIMV